MPFLRSPAFDLGWFVAPGVAAALVGAAIGLLDPRPPSSDSLALWVCGVVLVDVAHVYASLYRTYLDPVARRLHRTRLIAAPLLCLWLGFLLHLESPLLFWGALAYVAIFHFIKQHLGFALLYARAGGEDPRDRQLISLALWTGTLGPVLWWHAHLPTNFAWFTPGDLLVGLPAWVGTLALMLELPVWLVFLARRLELARRGRGGPMVPLLVLVPALCWHLGIVVFDDDRIFTITNVFLHGIPYMALVWLAGGRERVADRLPGAGPLRMLGAFYGLLLALALAEEALWDRLVWHEHPQLFGRSDGELDPVLGAALVALLAVPQATHYLLDRWIWRVGPDNPALADQLGLIPARPGPSASSVQSRDEPRKRAEDRPTRPGTCASPARGAADIVRQPPVHAHDHTENPTNIS